MIRNFLYVDECCVMNLDELRLLFKDWSVEAINQLYIEMLEDQDDSYY